MNGTPGTGVQVTRQRVLALGLLIGAIFAVYAVHLFRLQILRGGEYQVRARQVALRSLPIHAQRGQIYDRNYDMPLVTNIDSFAVNLVPGEIPRNEFDALLARLAEILSMTPEEIRQKLPTSSANIFQPIEIKAGVSMPIIIHLAERIEDFPGVSWHNKPIRNYLEGASMSHVLGYVGDITREELQVLYNLGYSANAVLGKSGIELQYDQVLRGRDGRRYRTVDVKGRRIETAPPIVVPPELGKNLVLTLDRRIQRLAEKALGNRVGSAVVLKPATGEILAMVSYPSFDPNLFYAPGSARVFQDLSRDTNFPFLNRAIQSSYPPASAYKIVMTAAAVEEEAIPLTKTITCTGQFAFGDRIFRCFRHAGHGPLALYDALAESCNVYYYTLGTEYLGVERIVDYSRRFGLGELTGIDLPGEVPGLLPSPQWKQRNHNSRWVGGDTVNMSIGQGHLGVTPIQMANVVAMIVNEGVVFKPRLLKEIREPVTGELVQRIEPEILSTSTIRASTFERVQEAMRRVITNGTARVVVTTDATTVAGKTGTGEVGLGDRWHSWFAAYAPYDADDPRERVVVVVMVEAVNKWEWWAPKAANIILHGIFAGQTYEEVLESLDVWYIPRGREE